MALYELARFITQAQRNAAFRQTARFPSRNRRTWKHAGQRSGFILAAQRRQQLPVNHMLQQGVTLQLFQAPQRFLITLRVAGVRAHDQAQTVRQHPPAGIRQRGLEFSPPVPGI